MVQLLYHKTQQQEAHLLKEHQWKAEHRKEHKQVILWNRFFKWQHRQCKQVTAKQL